MTDLLLPITEPGTATAPVVPTQPAWVDEVDGALVCTEVTRVTHDVTTFGFTLPEAARLSFLPGQYLTFAFPVDGIDQDPMERCYTISSPPTRPEQLTITVKRVPGGPVSNWLHDHLRVGDTLRAHGPYGCFSSAVHPADRYLFLTAGSGITPSMSMLRTLCDRGDPVEVAFVHSARTPDDIIFRNELHEIAQWSNVNVTIVCEDDSEREVWSGRRGRLTPSALLGAAPELLDMEIFSCGPAPYMAAVREMLDLLGVDASRCHEESFALGTPAAAPPEKTAGEAEAGATTYQVEFRRSGRSLECDQDTSLLMAAAQAGIALPSSCGEGMCGTCKSGLLAGEVDMQHAGGIRKREIDEGKILLCCSTPTSDLIIDA